MQINTTRSGDATVLEISGRMDATTVSEFTDAWQKASESSPLFIIDLAGVEYMSSAGLRGILTVAKTCKTSGKTLRFCALQAMVADLFKISGFTSILSVFSTREEALSA